MKNVAMKNIPALVALAFFFCVPSAFGQQVDRFSFSLYANTASPIMLGVGYQASEHVSIRTALGFSQYTQAYSEETTRDDRTVRWYGGAVAGLYEFTGVWHFRPYVGAEVQYAYAKGNKPGFSGRLENDRLDLGGLAGVELTLIPWIGFFGEVGVGYAIGYETNSIAGFDRRERGFGISHLGLGLQVHIGGR